MDYVYSVIILIGLFVVLASSFNLIIGYGGLISIAHPIFYGLGAYTSALLARDLGLPVPLSMLAGALLATALSVAMALPALRISGDYLLIASIGFQLGMIELIKNLRFTGGASGVSGIPAFLVPTFGREAYVALVIAVAIAVVLLVRWIAHSDYGRAISAMRDDEQAFAALGRDAKWIKVSLFALGSGIAGFRRRALCALFPLRHVGAVRDPDVVDDPDHGRGRRAQDAVGSRGRRHPAPDPAAGHHLPQSASGASGTAAGIAVHGAGADLHVPASGWAGAGGRVPGERHGSTRGGG